METPMNRRSSAHAVLWASAFVIAAMILTQAGRLPAAHGETADSQADYTILTSRTGRGPDERQWESLFVIDNREQVLLVYEVEDAQRQVMFLRARESLPALFATARR
jgi:hypothetical protein